MGFDAAEKIGFERFIQSIGSDVLEHLSSSDAVDFLSIIVDYSIDDTQFELRIARVFAKNPEKLDILKPAIYKLSVVRNEILKNGKNAEEARDIVSNYFNICIENLQDGIKQELDKQAQKDEDALEKLHKGDNQQQLEIQQEIDSLQKQRQELHEQEVAERKERKALKKEQEEHIQEIRQQEFEEAVKERKERKKRIEEQIEQLRVQLQQQHDLDMEEQKKIKQEKMREQEERRKEQAVLRDEQAQERRQLKEKEQSAMLKRQKELHEMQLKQKQERDAKRKQTLGKGYTH